MCYKRLLAFFLFFGIAIIAHTQNYAPNSSFECQDSCPVDPTTDLVFCKQWQGTPSGTTDYYSCSLAPNTMAGFQAARTGSSFAGILTWWNQPIYPNNYREYIQAPLLTPLKSGQCYEVSFYVSLSDYNYAIDSIGAYLSNGVINPTGLSLTPQVASPAGIFLTSKINWMQVTGTFTATGGEDYITIGNFSNDTNTDTIYAGGASPFSYKIAYYFVDDVCIKPCGSSCNDLLTMDLIKDTTICTGNGLTLDASTLKDSLWQYSDSIYTWNSGSSTDSLVVSPTLTTTYIVKFTNGCDSIQDTVRVTVFSPAVNAGSNDTICEGGISTLTAVATGTSGYLWSTGETTFAISVAPTITTSYTIIATQGNCHDTDVVFVKVDSLPNLNAGTNDTICEGNMSILTAVALSGSNYLWNTGATTSTISVTPTTNTSYTIIAIKGACHDTDIVNVKVDPSPNVNAGTNDTICEGSMSTLTAITTGTSEYLWSTGETTLVISVAPTITTSYTVIATQGNCHDTDVVFVKVDEYPSANAGSNDTICKGNTGSLAAIVVGASGYLWSTGETTLGINVVPTVTTSYTLIAIQGNCRDTGVVDVIVNNLPIVNAGTNITITSGFSANLSATGNGTFLWSPSAGLSCITCPSPIASPIQTTKYYVSITDSNGCTNLDSVLVTIYDGCENIFVPNAFSPNEDGQNDILFAYGNCIRLLTIYDRWGAKMFETENKTKGWDGNYKGQPMNTGVYFYTLNIIDNNRQEIIKSGSINLVK